MESLTKEILDRQWNELIKQQRNNNKPHCGNNPYYVYEQVDNLVPTETPASLEPSTVSLESPEALSEI